MSCRSRGHSKRGPAVAPGMGVSGVVELLEAVVESVVFVGYRGWEVGRLGVGSQIFCECVLDASLAMKAW